MAGFPGGESGDHFIATTDIRIGCGMCAEGCRLSVDGQAGMAAVAILSAWNAGDEADPIIMQVPSTTTESIDHPRMTVPRSATLSIGQGQDVGFEPECATDCAYRDELPKIRDGLMAAIASTGMLVEEVRAI